MPGFKHFEPMVREVFGCKAWDEAHIKPGVVAGLPADKHPILKSTDIILGKYLRGCGRGPYRP